jgi:hypothetical protein
MGENTIFFLFATHWLASGAENLADGQLLDWVVCLRMELQGLMK